MKYTLLTGLFLVFLAPLSAFAADSVEPQISILTKGRDIEWQQSHVQGTSSAEHRIFHRDIQQKHQEWLSSWKDSKGTTGYLRSYRLFRQDMSDAHRTFHAEERGEPASGDFEDDESGSVTRPRFTPNNGWESSGWVEIVGDGSGIEAGIIVPDRTYTVRPSRRAIIEAAKASRR